MNVLVIITYQLILVGSLCIVTGDPLSDLERPSRIVGGKPVDPGEISWQVSLQRVLDGGRKMHFCGGALVADSWVATAAHCTRDIQLSKTVAVLGAWNLKEENIEFRISKIFRNEFDEISMKNDLALLKLDRKLRHKKLSQRKSKKISMERKIDVSGKECLISGWGRLSFEGNLPDILHAAEVSLLSDDECEEALGNTTSKKIFKSNICAGGGDTDACQGDSGGPLVCCGDSKSFTNCSLTGITSWGIGCATPGIPGIYTEIAYYKDWINRIIKIESD